LGEVVDAIDDLPTLEDMASDTVHNLDAARAVFARSVRIRADPGRFCAYLAQAYLFAGWEETAAAIIHGPPVQRDPLLWQTWAIMASDASETKQRLREGLAVCDEQLPLWRQLATTAMSSGDQEQAVAAFRWLAVRDPSPLARQRYKALLGEAPTSG